MTVQDVDSSLVLGADGARPANVGAIVRKTLKLGADLAARFGVLIAFALLWEYGGRLGFLNSAVIPPLSDVIWALRDGLASGPLKEDLGISLTRAGVAFGAAAVVGIPLGLVMGQLPTVEKLIDPLLQLFRQTSALALYPVFILLLGLGETSKIFVIFWASLFPILLATIGGVQEVDGKLIEMARVYGARRLTIFRRVVLPGAVPQVFVGLRLSATTALLMLIAAEMIGANHGVGFQVMNAQYNFQIPLMFASIVLLALLGLAANYAILGLQRRLCRWNAAA